MEFLFQIPLLGRKKNANRASLAEGGMDAGTVGLADGLTSATELPSAAAALADLFDEDEKIRAEAEAAVAVDLATVGQILGGNGRLASEMPEEMLTPASELPSGADMLAEIFPEELPAGTSIIQFPASNGNAEVTEEYGTRSGEFPDGKHRGAALRIPSGQESAKTPEDSTNHMSELKLRPPKLQEISATHEGNGLEASPSDLEVRPSTVSAIAEPDGAKGLETESEEALVGHATVPEISEAHEASAPDASAGDTPVAASNGPARDWAFEEKLASHREWVESRGAEGKQGYLGGAKLEGAELVGVNLRYVDLHDANLKGADLLLADLRDACLARANLDDATLVGTNLEGANLEGASLASAMGIVPRQLAGANLYQATLPEQITLFEACGEFEHASKMAQRMLAIVTPLCLLACLIVWKTRDAQLVANSAVLYFLHSAKAAAALPTVQLYSIVPVLLVILYLVFQFHLQRLWDATLELPAVFPDGKRLGDTHEERAGGRTSRIVLGLLRAHFRWMDQDAPSTRTIEKALSVLVAYWVVPATLVLFWARTLTLGEMRGTMLHLALVATSTGVAFYSTTRVGRPQETWTKRQTVAARMVNKVRQIKPATLGVGLAAALALISIGTVKGVPHDPRRAAQYGAADIRRWAPSVLWAADYDSFPDLTEAVVSAKPEGWSYRDEDLWEVRGARMNGVNLRYAQAYGVFLVNAHLWRADFEGASMPEADLRGADLGESNLRYADVDGARMYRANLDRVQLEGGNLARADLREANMSYDALGNAILTDARLDGATLYDAHAEAATLIRANLERADLRGASLGGANLDDADLQQAYLWSAKLPGARLEGARLGAALAIEADLSGADMERAQFPGTVLTSARFDGANLDGADLRGAFGLTATQVCSARSHAGALLDAALQAQVEAQCGGANAAAARP